jgi:hypothetical protein
MHRPRTRFVPDRGQLAAVGGEGQDDADDWGQPDDPG